MAHEPSLLNAPRPSKRRAAATNKFTRADYVVASAVAEPCPAFGPSASIVELTLIRAGVFDSCCGVVVIPPRGRYAEPELIKFPREAIVDDPGLDWCPAAFRDDRRRVLNLVTLHAREAAIRRYAAQIAQRTSTRLRLRGSAKRYW